MWTCYDKWAFLMKIERWYNSAFFYKEEFQVMSKQLMSDCCRLNSSGS
jgi:hypothetical protein